MPDPHGYTQCLKSTIGFEAEEWFEAKRCICSYNESFSGLKKKVSMNVYAAARPAAKLLDNLYATLSPLYFALRLWQHSASGNMCYIANKILCCFGTL